MLLAGPRGRRLCWAAVDALAFAQTGRSQLHGVECAAVPDGVLSAVQRVVADTDLSLLASWTEPVSLLHRVADSVDSARYWQDPDEVDRVLGRPAVADLLWPVAEAIGAAPAATWWSAAVALDEQVLVDWRPVSDRSPQLKGGAAVVLSQWKQRVADNEVRLRTRHVSAEWWSPPIWGLSVEEAQRWGTGRPELHSTTRSLPGLGAVELLLVEDRAGASSALCRTVRCGRPPTVFEIQDADDWRDLVERYPIEVTYGRRGNWREATGLDGRWLLPDWALVAQDYDAVHLSLLGYLASSGRALQLDPGVATFIAGWNPDKTYWLSDALTPAGEPAEWVAPEHTREWRSSASLGA